MLTGSSNPRPRHYGRVRSGCTTCRARKVKCDEAKPICDNCTRLNRDCHYKMEIGKAHQTAPRPVLEAPSNLCQDVTYGHTPLRSAGLSRESSSHRLSSHGSSRSHGGKRDSCDRNAHHQDAGITQYSELPERTTSVLSPVKHDLPSSCVSRDIALTTTMDLLRARDDTSAPSVEFFIDHVECPGISPFDPVGWSLMKHRVADMSYLHREVRLAIVALSALCKAIHFRLSDQKALDSYHIAKDAANKYLRSSTNQSCVALIVMFLLSHFELLYSGAIVPFMKDQSTSFSNEMQLWMSDKGQHSELDSRLLVWLKIIFCTSLRGGGNSVVSHEIYQLIPYHETSARHIPFATNSPVDLTTQVYQLLSAPVFDFYFRLQISSGEIAMMTHYHRS